MLSSCLELNVSGARRAAARLCGLLLVTGVGGSGIAAAAETYFVPDINVGAEYHSNLDLDASDQSGEGYIANVSGIAGVRTPRGVTEVRPTIRFQEYPDRDDMKRTNGQLDLLSRYNSQRGSLQFDGTYRVEDRYNAEIVNAGFDEFNPNAPAPDGTGHLVFTPETRTFIQLHPRAVYRLTQRLGIGVDATYQDSSSDQGGGADYSYTRANGFLSWKVGQRSELGTGVYVARYKVDNGSNTTDSVGVSVDLEHDWSETFTGTASLNVEQTDVKYSAGAKDSSNNWGLMFGVVRKGEVDQLRLLAGRSFNPTSGGVRSEMDEIRLQYDRTMQRWSFMGAVRGFRTRAQGIIGSGNDRNFARVQLELRRSLSRTWYVGAGYNYIWQKYVIDPTDAADNLLFVRIGYKGLPPQR